ncbi:hypothetical protein AB6A40_006810 [Gnathostoma spinigerum]|uniref:Adenylyltransferase and sulfurtransferase MOCS3 homolog n=1 Tax=Gnathostoma spinigerum TaxID=75299 RepID=A0ABD6ELF9_9BILA
MSFSEYHSLSKDQIRRYSRQILVNELGAEGQQRILETSLLIVGAGGLGCPVAIYTAAAGISHIGIIDDDEIAIENLHRQIAHSLNAVGSPKANSISDAIHRLDPAVHVDVYNCRLKADNCMKIISKYDIIADCTDNAATRYLINDACVLCRKPLVSGSALRWEGQMTVYNNGERCPCYRCIFPVPPPTNVLTSCSESGVIGPVVGVIGNMQALEIIKISAGLESSYSGQLFLFDGLSGRTRDIRLRTRKNDCVVCGRNARIKDLSDIETSCGAKFDDKAESLYVLPAEKRISAMDYDLIRNRDRESLILLDVRPITEFKIAHLPEAKNIEYERIASTNIEDLKKLIGCSKNDSVNSLEVYVICRRGNNSQLAVQQMENLFKNELLSVTFKDIIGGYQSWTETVDSNFPVY